MATGIGKQVDDAIGKLASGDSHGALFAICAAAEATAKKEGYGSGSGQAFKGFLDDNLGFITGFVSGIQKLNVHVEYDHPDVKKNSKGLCSLQAIFYHAVRCGLYHKADLPDNLEFRKGGRWEVRDDMLILPSELIIGLIVAVVVSAANSGEVLPDVPNELCSLDFCGIRIPISMLWGRKQEVLWLLDVRAELGRLRARQISAE